MKQNTRQKSVSPALPLLLLLLSLVILGVVGLVYVQYNQQLINLDSQQTKAAPQANCSSSFTVPLFRCGELCNSDSDCDTGYCYQPPSILCAKAPCEQPLPSCRNKTNTADPTCQANKITTTPEPSHPISWKTSTIQLTASDFSIEANGKKFSPTTQVTVHSDPGWNTYTTLEATWFDQGIEMRLNMYLHADATHWWVSEMRTYDGRSRGDWIYYTAGNYFTAPLGKADTRLNLLYVSNPSNTNTGKIIFRNLSLTPTFSGPRVTPQPSPQPTRWSTPWPRFTPVPSFRITPRPMYTPVPWGSRAPVPRIISSTPTPVPFPVISSPPSTWLNTLPPSWRIRLYQLFGWN